MNNKRDWPVHPPHLYPEYKSTILRSPTKPLVIVKEYFKDVSLPVFGESVIGKFDNDLTKNARTNGEPIGERIKVSGKVMDEYGRSLPNVLVEIWQAALACHISTNTFGNDLPYSSITLPDTLMRSPIGSPFVRAFFVRSLSNFPITDSPNTGRLTSLKYSFTITNGFVGLRRIVDLYSGYKCGGCSDQFLLLFIQFRFRYYVIFRSRRTRRALCCQHLSFCF